MSKSKLAFLKEAEESIFFESLEYDKTYDFLKHYDGDNAEPGERRTFTLTPNTEGYYLEEYRDDDGYTFVFRENNKILFLSIDPDGGIDETYVLNIVEKQ